MIRKILNKKNLLKIIVIALLLVAGFYGYKYISEKNMTPEQKIAAGQAKAEADTKEITDKVSKVMLLPDEVPSLFEVTDPETLSKQQEFFKGAVQGDKLLVYVLAGKAIIWSPSRNVVVNVGPISNDNQPIRSN